MFLWGWSFSFGPFVCEKTNAKLIILQPIPGAFLLPFSIKIGILA